jgi:anti-anti-sigma factor
LPLLQPSETTRTMHSADTNPAVQPSRPDIDVFDAEGDRWVVALRGEHDIATADQLAERFDAIFAEGTKIVVDLSEADFIDSSTVRVILQAYRYAEATHGDKVVLVVPPANTTLQRLLEVSGLGRILPVFQDRQQALSALA